MRPTRGLILAVVLLGACACGRDETPPEATSESVALGLFELARATDLEAADVEGSFGAIASDADRAELFDALRDLHAVGPVEIVDSYTLEGGARVGYDLEAAVGEGGAARYSVLLNVSTPPGTIVWFSGPGVEWPERRRRDDGTTTSAPPGGAEPG